MSAPVVFRDVYARCMRMSFNTKHHMEQLAWRAISLRLGLHEVKLVAGCYQLNYTVSTFLTNSKRNAEEFLERSVKIKMCWLTKPGRYQLLNICESYDHFGKRIQALFIKGINNNLKENKHNVLECTALQCLIKKGFSQYDSLVIRYCCHM